MGDAPVSSSTGHGSSAPQPARARDVALPSLGLAGTLRWMWTQLTSMRTALMLLLLLAVAAVPGSLVPQRRAGPEVVDRWIEDNPFWGPVLDALQFFDVYTSAWFSAIYLLLFISLVGCVWPRAVKHAHALRQPPARTPRRLERLPESGVVVLEEGGPAPEDAVRQAQAWLKRRRYRVEYRPEEGGASVGAERGYVREIGNILFHLSLIGVLVFMAYGGMTKYTGQKIIVEGEGFANNLVAYDSFTPGARFDPNSLQPFSLALTSFDARFERQSEAHWGQPLDYTAVMEVREGAGGEAHEEILKVNHPLSVDGARVYLVGNGYAPVVTVRDGNGDIAFQGPVVTRVQDQNFNSMAVVKAPDARPEQLGFVGQFMPAADDPTGSGVQVSVDPELLNPTLILNSYAGDLGLDRGVPQNVYVLDTESLTELNSRKSENGGITLTPGQTHQLPDGKGSISFDGVRRYVGLDIHYDPGKWGVGLFAVTALLGLATSLFVRRRRAWVRAAVGDDGRTRVEYALLARGEEFGLREEHLALRAAMDRMWPVSAPDAEEHRPDPSGAGAATAAPRAPHADPGITHPAPGA
ncbi:cytochrome c biogenesis protein ResB [Micrococcus sp. NPDC055215]